jgi:Ribbon-helix-helix protein, copG family
MGTKRPEWKGERHQVNIRLSPQALKSLRSLVRRWKIPQSDVIEELLRRERERR